MKLHHLAILFTTSSFAMGVTIPVTSLILLGKGFSLSSLSLVLGLYSLVVITVEIPSGIIADRYGRKACFILSKLLSTAGSLLLAIAQTPLVFVLAVLCLATARAFISGSLEALAIDWHNLQFGTEKLGKITARLSLWETVGLSTGSLASGFIILAFSPIAGNIGPYGGNYLFSAVLQFFTAILALQWVSEMPSDEKTEKRETGMHPIIKQMRTNKLFSSLLLTSVATGFLLSSLEKYWQPRLFQLANGSEQTTILLGLLAFIGFLGALVGSEISGRINIRKGNSFFFLFLIFRILLATSVLGLSLVTPVLGYTLLYFLTYLWLGLAGVTEQVMANRLIPSHLRASLLSTLSFALQGGGLLASGFGAYFLSRPSNTITGLWISSVVVVLISLFPFLFQRRAFHTLLAQS